MRVFMDANILFSAADPDSATRILLDRVLECGEAVSNQHAIEEARRNLAAKRPQFLTEFERIKKLVTITMAFTTVEGVDLPVEDTPVLAGAVGARCTHLLTGDRRHFGKLYGRTIRRVRIVSSVMLVDEMHLTTNS